MDAMEKEEKITADMRALVKEQIVADFVSSETGKRMALAQRRGALYREKPFVMGFTEEELENYGFGVGAQITQIPVQNIDEMHNRTLRSGKGSSRKKSCA